MNYTGQNIGSSTFPMRDKYWREKNANEKLEVVAELLAKACAEIKTLNERLDEMTLHSHHSVSGAVLVPPRDQYGVVNIPRGYCHEEFMLGRAPREHYESPAVAPPGWPGEAQAEGALPPPQPAPAPATGPENQPDAGPRLADWPLKGGPDKLADPDWPKEPPNPQFHPTEPIR
jgi:hypothetical protein